MQHTPGPWLADFTIRKTGATRVTGPDKEAVAWSVGLDGTRSKAVALANARLIAAAPDMLDALRGLAWNHHDDHDDPDAMPCADPGNCWLCVSRVLLSRLEA